MVSICVFLSHYCRYRLLLGLLFSFSSFVPSSLRRGRHHQPSLPCLQTHRLSPLAECQKPQYHHGHRNQFGWGAEALAILHHPPLPLLCYAQVCLGQHRCRHYHRCPLLHHLFSPLSRVFVGPDLRRHHHLNLKCRYWAAGHRAPSRSRGSLDLPRPYYRLRPQRQPPCSPPCPHPPTTPNYTSSLYLVKCWMAPFSARAPRVLLPFLCGSP